MRNRINAVVIMGGPSAENEVSLKTGFEIYSHLDPDKYSRRAVVYSKKKQFHFSESDVDISQDEILEFENSGKFSSGVNPASSYKYWNNCDIVFNGLHGEFGEDGRIQGYFDTIGVKYTGSKVLASALAMDKIMTKHILEISNIGTAPYIVYSVNKKSPSLDAIGKEIGFPCYVKAPQSGSSRLMGVAKNRAKLTKLIEELSCYADNILVEKNITGDEYSVPVIELGDGSLKPLLPILIKPENSFFDFEAKYLGKSQEIIPPPCSEDLIQKLQAVALETHCAVGCKTLSRTDIIVTEKAELMVLEINTLPGFTQASLLPKSFAVTEGSFADLLDILAESTLNKEIK